MGQLWLSEAFWHTTTHVCLYVVLRLSCATVAELSSNDRDSISTKPKIFSTWPFTRKVYWSLF